MELNFNSVETVANLNASAAFQIDSSKVFKEDTDIVPVIIDERLSYMPWGGDNELPYNILNLIESDETLSTCQQFNAEVCYGSGLRYNVDQCTKAVRQEVDDFLLDNAMAQYWLGVCHDYDLDSPVSRFGRMSFSMWSRMLVSSALVLARSMAIRVSRKLRIPFSNGVAAR